MDIPGWEERDNKLIKELKFSDFKAALGFVNKVGILAEEAQHHPDIHVLYNKVKLELSTHDEGGVTNKDCSLAQKINEINA